MAISKSTARHGANVTTRLERDFGYPRRSAVVEDEMQLFLIDPTTGEQKRID